MVGPLTLLKLLHHKQVRRRKSSKKSTDERENSLESKVKTEPLQYEDYTCRVCLKGGNIPIFGDEIYRDISHKLHTFGGIEVQVDDEYPKYICLTCKDLLQGAVLLRKTAQRSERILRTTPDLVSDHNDIPDDTGEVDHIDFEDEKKVEAEYHCQRCNLDFHNFNDYSEHRLTLEHETMKQKCPICNNLYNEAYLKKHLLLHSKAEAPHMCDICGKKFIIQGQLTRHRLTHFYHLPFKCSLCPYRGRFTESLKMHMRSHTGDKPYQCTQCAHRFVNKSNLNKHMLTHKTQHDFKCESCGRGFYTKRDLDLHFKVDHTGIKDHVCNICGKAFGYRKQMMKHQLKVHKREKLRSGRMPLYLLVDSKESNQEDLDDKRIDD